MGVYFSKGGRVALQLQLQLRLRVLYSYEYSYSYSYSSSSSSFNGFITQGGFSIPEMYRSRPSGDLNANVRRDAPG